MRCHVRTPVVAKLFFRGVPVRREIVGQIATRHLSRPRSELFLRVIDVDLFSLGSTGQGIKDYVTVCIFDVLSLSSLYRDCLEDARGQCDELIDVLFEVAGRVRRERIEHLHVSCGVAYVVDHFPPGLVFD